MKIRCIAAICFSGALSLAGLVQESAAQLKTPTAVSLTGGSPRRLHVGDLYICQLMFDVAPEAYGSGGIMYRFERVKEPSDPLKFPGGEAQLFEAAIELHDGQAIYEVSFPIRAEMTPGKWRLAKVSLGRTVLRDLPVPENIAFEIPELSPVSAKIQTPANVQAGHVLPIKIMLDRYPDVEGVGCVIVISGFIHQASPQGLPVSGSYLSPVIPVRLIPNQLIYELSVDLASDTPSGPWVGDLSFGQQGNGFRQPFCRLSEFKASTHFTFSVEPSPNLVTPTSVTVLVNPSQIQLLLGESDRLNAKIEKLKKQLRSENEATNLAILRDSVDEALRNVDRTETTYKEQGTGPSYSKAVNIFFDDIRFHYGEALKALANQSTQVHHSAPHLERVTVGAGDLPARTISGLSGIVLASISHHATAYFVAGSSGTMNIDVDVSSSPKGAAVSYRQRTDPEFYPLDHETDWRIPNLYRATYFIRFQKAGCKEQVLTFEGGSSTSTSVHADLVCQGRKQ